MDLVDFGENRTLKIEYWRFVWYDFYITKEEGTDMKFNWNLFWNAFGAIGTTLGTFATAIAALLAYKQYNLSKSSKLKVKLESETITKSSDSGTEQKYIVLKFFNKGIIDLYVNEIAIKVKGEYFRIENFFTIEIEGEDDTKNQIFPVKVTNEKTVSAKIPIASLKMQIDCIKRKNNKKNINPIIFVIIDGKGKEYKKILR